MKPHISYYLTIVILLIPGSIRCPNNNPVEVIRHVVRSHRMPAELAQSRLLGCFLQSESIPLPAMRAALNKLFEVGPPIALQEQPNLLNRAVEQFHNAPGFQIILRTLLMDKSQSHRIRDHALWKLSCALHYTQNIRRPEHVVAFEQEHYCPLRGHSHIFGVISKEENDREIWTTCKGDPWYGLPRTSKLAKALRQQKTIVRNAGKSVAISPRYRVCAQHLPPDDWQNWLKEHNIFVDVPRTNSNR